MKTPAFFIDTVTKTSGFCFICLFLFMEPVLAQSADTTATPDSLSHATKAKKYSTLHPENESEWGDYQDITNPDSVKQLEGFTLKDSVEVFGWHPYWNGTAYTNYNFSLLSSIAYFSYELDPKTGSYKTIHDWKTTGLIDSAKTANPDISILLTVTNFGSKNNREFLGMIREKGARQQALIDSLQALLALRKADGVVIDFEGVERLEKGHLTNFMKQLSQSLKVNNYTLAMTLPSDDPHEIYDVKELASSVDKFIVMTYGYYWSKSKKAGPVAPLVSSNTWGENSVTTTLNKYQKLGLSPSQTIVGVPYYGELWETKSTDIPSDARIFVGSRTYKQVREAFPYKPKFDQESNSVYYAFKRQDNGQDRQLWFGNEESLSALYDEVNKQNYGGIGIWALGDDDGYTELWNLIAGKFAVPDTGSDSKKPADEIEEEGEKIIDLIKSYLTKINGKIGLGRDLETPIIFLILLALAIILLPLGLFIVGIKMFFKEHKAGIYLSVSIILLVSIIFDKDILIDSPAKISSADMILTLLATATVGILVANLLHSLVFNKKDLP